MSPLISSSLGTFNSIDSTRGRFVASNKRIHRLTSDFKLGYYSSGSRSSGSPGAGTTVGMGKFDSRRRPLFSDGRQVAVVGGGVIGCATAYQLARAGLKVTLIERDAIGAHASSRNAGNLNPLHGTQPAQVQFAIEAFHIHAEVGAELAQLGCANYVLSPVKRIFLGCDETDRQQLNETAALFNATKGFSAVWLDNDNLRRIEPCVAQDIEFGVLTEGSLSVDGSDFTRSLAEGAGRLGAAIVHEKALGVVEAGGRVTGIKTGRGIIHCDELVLATGPWVTETNSWLGLDLPIEPVKGELLLMRFPERMPRFDVTWGLTSLYRRRGNEIWIGVTVKSCGFDCTPTLEARELLLARAERIMPCIRRAPVIDHVAALRPVAQSNVPIACRAYGWQNVYIANGGGSKGILLSVGIARRIRDLLGGRSRLVSKDPIV
jgi:glycine oxidase